MLNSWQCHPNVFPCLHRKNVCQRIDKIPHSQVGKLLQFSPKLLPFVNEIGARLYNKSIRIRRSLNSATEEDLFQGIAQAVKEDNRLPANYRVPDIMRSWTRQSGFPILNITRDYNNGYAIVSQTRYYNNAELHGTSNATWWIPFNFITANSSLSSANETVAEHWLSTSSSIVRPTNSSQWTSNDWMFFNKHATGYYRVMYDKRNYDLLAIALKNNKAPQIDTLGRSQLIDDAYQFLQTTRWNDYADVLNLMQFLKNDDTYAPWMTASKILRYLKPRLAGTDQYNRFEKFQRAMVEKLYKTVGIEDKNNESLLNKYTRNVAIELACANGLSACLSDASAKLKNVLDSKQDFHQNVRNVMYCESVRGTKRPEYNSLWMLLADFNNSERTYRNLLIRALSCVNEKKLLNEYLRSALNSTNDNLIVYMPLEQQQVVSAVYQNSVTGHQLAIGFITKNIDEAYRTYGSNGLGNIISGIASRVTSKSTRSDVCDFLYLSIGTLCILYFNSMLQYEKLSKLAGQKGYVSQANLDIYAGYVNQNFQWNDQYLSGINTWLKQNY